MKRFSAILPFLALGFMLHGSAFAGGLSDALLAALTCMDEEQKVIAYCDYNNDGTVTDEEKDTCKCDFNNDGEVDEEEESVCSDDQILCDFDRDGTLDDNERYLCACDSNRDGSVDEDEKELCTGEQHHGECEETFQAGIEAGRRQCIQDPASCGMVPKDGEIGAGACATFDTLTGLLNIPCLAMEQNYYLNMSILDYETRTFGVVGFGLTEGGMEPEPEPDGDIVNPLPY